MAAPRIRRLHAALLLGVQLSGAVAVCGSETPRSHEQLLRWSEGPVRWLLQPIELRDLRRAETDAEAVNFVESFWARRDPDPLGEANTFRRVFLERVETADILYPESGVRGSLTDRGRAMILLGPPHELRITSRQALDWNPRRRRGRGGKVVVRELPMEVWVYRLEILPEVLAQAFSPMAEDGRIEIAFVVEPEQTRLSRGVELLELASRVALARPH